MTSYLYTTNIHVFLSYSKEFVESLSDLVSLTCTEHASFRLERESSEESSRTPSQLDRVRAVAKYSIPLPVNTTQNGRCLVSLSNDMTSWIATFINVNNITDRHDSFEIVFVESEVVAILLTLNDRCRSET